MAGLPALRDEVQAVYDACPQPVRQGLHQLRGLILAQAALMPQIGPVTEALRWGQPAFLTLDSGAACSLRIGPIKGQGFGLFVQCQTGLIAAFAAGAGVGLRFGGTRAVLFGPEHGIDPAQMSVLIGQALGYHLRQAGPGLSKLNQKTAQNP
jgi:hypothetical protein